MASNFFGRDLDLLQAHWQGRNRRPLFGCNLSFQSMAQHYPNAAVEGHAGVIEPNDIDIDALLRDVDRAYDLHSRLNDDFPYLQIPS